MDIFWGDFASAESTTEAAGTLTTCHFLNGYGSVLEVRDPCQNNKGTEGNSADKGHSNRNLKRLLNLKEKPRLRTRSYASKSPLASFRFFSSSFFSFFFLPLMQFCLFVCFEDTWEPNIHNFSKIF